MQEQIFPNQTFPNDDIDLSYGEQFPELKLSMSDEELLDSAKKYKASGQVARKDMDEKWTQNVDYWKGDAYKHNDWVVDDEDLRHSENRIFSAVETFLPILNRQAIDPTVQIENREERVSNPAAKEVANKVREELLTLIDEDQAKIEIGKATRFWVLNQLGVIKVFWNKDENRIDLKVVKAKNMIFQDGASIDKGIYNGEFLGEYMAKTGAELKEMFPKKKAVIDQVTKGKDGTRVKFIEWSTRTITFWELDGQGEILDKIKNPDWNYDTEVETYDEFGNPIVMDQKGINHFNSPQFKYAFFSVYNLGESVFDDTGLIQQSKKAQDTINDRNRQIYRNVQNQNNSVVFYGMDETKARTALRELNKGGGVLLTDKNNQGMERVGGNQLAGDVYNELNMNRSSIDSIFATNAITRGETSNETTVRGKIIAKQSDVDRISFIASYLEQFVDRILNIMVQMMYVYYETTSPSGLHRDEFQQIGKLLVSVKDGSLIPKDPLTEANQAVDLASQGMLDILTLYERLDFENPKEIALRTMLYRNDPMMYMQQVLGFQPPMPAMPPGMPGMEQPGGAPPAGVEQGGISEQMMPQVPDQQQDVLNQVPIQ